MHLKQPGLFKQLNMINGQWVPAHSGATFAVDNPFDGSCVGHVPKGDAQDAKHAIDAAHAALPAWKSKTAKERALILRQWAELIDAHKDDLALIMTTEQGKPLAEAKGEVDYGNAFLHWFAEEAKRVYGDVIPTIAADRRLLTIKQPIGVCAAITPWNFPIAMILRKCAPALAVGCTVVIKPAEATPFSALALMVLAEQAGLPAGVVNMITGDPVAIGQVFSTHPLVRKLSFTGSTRVGKLLMQQSSGTVKKLSLELGGNAPFVVFEDADIAQAVKGLMLAKFRNAGQTCIAANRVYVHDAVYDAFVAQLVEKVRAIKVGNGLQADVNIGPLITQAAVEKVERLVANAVQQGARVLVGGVRHPSSALAYQPTLLVDVPDSAEMACEEIFGPVLALYRFRDEADVIARANNTRYGLAAYFYSCDISRVWRVAEALEYGMVSINQGLFSSEVAPFGGIKESGFGREGSKYGVEDFLEIKYLCMGVG